MKIVVLGGSGAMGQIIVRDLLENSNIPEIVIGELNYESAKKFASSLKNKRICAQKVDVTDKKSLLVILEGASVVINSTQYYFNMEVIQGALEAGVHYTDLGGLFHYTRKQLALKDEFKKKNLTAVLGSGSTPGMTNVMAAYAASKLDTVYSAHVKIGAVDFTKMDSPLASPYSIQTILDECTMNPMIFTKGKFQEVAPFSGKERVIFPPPVGDAEANYTLHSEVATFPLCFKDKGIREASFRIAFPADFISKLKLLVDLGLASDKPVEMKGAKIKPRNLLIKIISDQTPQNIEPDDCDVIRVEVSGKKDKRKVQYTMESIVRPHPKWKVSAGALDTGVPASIVGIMLAEGVITKRGVLAPEECIEPLNFFRELARRNINVYSVVKEELY
ncbi:MAG: saccharopine dehydrogenase NADP-binding domain-containing protein [Firmicutes bacterium]|nr:saccharopine dehydrogenase NADP-binding domain-containing protein [Bacillota bacterium]